MTLVIKYTYYFFSGPLQYHDNICQNNTRGAYSVRNNIEKDRFDWKYEAFPRGNTLQSCNVDDLERETRQSEQSEKDHMPQTNFNDFHFVKPHSLFQTLNSNGWSNDYYRRNGTNSDRYEMAHHEQYSTYTSKEGKHEENNANCEDTHTIQMDLNVNSKSATPDPPLYSHNKVFEDTNSSMNGNLAEHNPIIQKIDGSNGFKEPLIQLNLPPVEANFSIVSKTSFVNKYQNWQCRKPTVNNGHVTKTSARVEKSPIHSKAPKNAQEKSQRTKVSLIQIKKVKYPLFSDFMNFDSDESSNPTTSDLAETMSLANREGARKRNEATTSDKNLNSKVGQNQMHIEDERSIEKPLHSTINNTNVEANLPDESTNGEILQIEDSINEYNTNIKHLKQKLTNDLLQNGRDKKIMLGGIVDVGNSQIEFHPVKCPNERDLKHETQVERDNVPQGLTLNFQEFLRNKKQAKNKTSAVKTTKIIPSCSSLRDEKQCETTTKDTPRSKKSAAKDKKSAKRKDNSTKVKKGGTNKKVTANVKQTKTNLNKSSNSKPKNVRHKIVFKQTHESEQVNVIEAATEDTEEAICERFGNNEKQKNSIEPVLSKKTTGSIKDKLKRFSKGFVSDGPLFAKATTEIQNKPHNDELSENLASFPEDCRGAHATPTDINDSTVDATNKGLKADVNKPAFKETKLDVSDARKEKVNRVLKFENEDEILFVETQELPPPSQTKIETKKKKIQFSNPKRKIDAVETTATSIRRSINDCSNKNHRGIKKPNGKFKTKFIPPIRKELLDLIKSAIPLKSQVLDTQNANSQILDTQNISSQLLESQMSSQNPKTPVESVAIFEKDTAVEEFDLKFESDQIFQSKNLRQADSKFEKFEEPAFDFDQKFNTRSSGQNLDCPTVEDNLMNRMSEDRKEPALNDKGG